MDDIVKSQPLVSVVCTAYNHQDYIRDTLDGFVMQQTTFPIEIIVHDDASTDDTAAIIRKYENRYPHLFRNIYQAENQYSKGVNIWRQLFANYCRGKYIAICEGDDYWTDPMKLQKQVDFLEGHVDYGLIYTDVDFMYQERNYIERAVFGNHKLPVYTSFNEMLMNKGYIAPCSWVLRKDLIPDVFDKTYADLTFVLALEILWVSKVKFLSEVTTVYRILKESASHSVSIEKRYIRELDLYNTQKQYIEKCNVGSVLKKRIEKEFYELIIPFSIAVKDRELTNIAFKNCKINTCKKKIYFIMYKAHLECIMKLFYYIKYTL